MPIISYYMLVAMGGVWRSRICYGGSVRVKMSYIKKYNKDSRKTQERPRGITRGWGGGIELHDRRPCMQLSPKEITLCTEACRSLGKAAKYDTQSEPPPTQLVMQLVKLAESRGENPYSK